MNADTAPLSWEWGGKRGRRTICGFNVAGDCLGGLVLLIGIPALVVAHLAAVVLTPLFTASHDGNTLLLEVLLELFLCMGAVALLFLLLVADPGFVEVPTPLSCRCSHCGTEVDDFDHHCGAVGACIGKGNMCYFILFLLFAALLCVLGAVQNVAFVAATVRAHIRDAGTSWTSIAALIRNIFTTLCWPRILCLLALSVAAVNGGVVCTFLCLRYTYLAYKGLSSVRRRRQFDVSGSLSKVFASTFRPAFSHNFILPRYHALADVSD
ncbi:conserved hypothetical protein [Leishmania major strain Friedlin]|uniref:Palmitoyltransferase n=1 Tax=Leishmania major TaxID=5664 RepID=Q4Q2B1_LEIMA|nr:conserved hypothetical protein [Leishmania major strain Friedlin]CAG9582312.1 DHHC_palmitoyltransferase_-_putative [Leishmania major strain Friedlin]CAJ08167.1 conserved hypothetical protein [Leishmania major strain Friedlin]|eukprot:XP_001686537.1 conserved hypothetical protein [Leishmania major strain Friedlin]